MFFTSITTSVQVHSSEQQQLEWYLGVRICDGDVHYHAFPSMKIFYTLSFKSAKSPGHPIYNCIIK